MITINLKKRGITKLLVPMLSILTIVAFAYPAMGSVQADSQDPYLRAFPDQDYVDGSNWPANSPVNLVVNGYTSTQPANGNGYVEFFLKDWYDLVQGDMLTMSSGDIQVVYTARQLYVSDLNMETQTISGTVDGAQEVHVWVGEVSDDYVDAEDGVNWLVDLSGYEQPILVPGVCGNAEAWGDNASASSTIIDLCIPGPTPWRDEFVDGALAEGWYWLDENPEKWSLTENPGFLRIYAAPYTGTSETPSGRNLLLRPVAQGDFSIETRVLFEPAANFQFAGLYIYQGDGNALAFGRAFCDIADACVGNGIYFDYLAGGNLIESNFATQVGTPNEAYLRLERRGTMVRALFSYEGITWTEIGTHWLPDGYQVNGVGLYSAQDIDKSDPDIPADFDYFEMTEGWGFLPEGFHDYDSGEVPSGSCNAGGWAADPDDRLTDLAVEIDVDGTPLPDWLYAGEYRQDLDTAGVCVDGNCGFSTSLWGTIPAYEPHSIVAYAQDVPSGEWVRLGNSPRDLTCRTYDIYVYDPLNGTTMPVTDLRDTDEFNPSWSPNGKKVAHDVLFGDGSYALYITDLKNGRSTPLKGAQGGNDAAWSPNGDWIAFDRNPNDPSLWLVPADGGKAKLVLNDAVSADWAPNSKRLVYQQPSSGSVKTVSVDGGSGPVTIVAATGANPVWSPDGDWIAYDNGGDIWKVQVNLSGVALGEPIQLTSSPFYDGQATWLPDGTSIAYHSGLNTYWDIWRVSADGGLGTWLTGAVGPGDYDPAYARKGQMLSYASVSPNGQSPRTWVSAFTYDLPGGYWTEGTHAYHFWSAYNEGSQEISFEVDNAAPLYDGTVLFRPLRALYRSGGECITITSIRSAQPTQFHIGWTADGTYADALNYYANLMADVTWDGNLPEALVQHEIFPSTSDADWLSYVCSYPSP